MINPAFAGFYFFKFNLSWKGDDWEFFRMEFLAKLQKNDY